MDEYFAFDRSTRLMVLAPHPDDETLAAGGLLQRASQAGAQILVLYATNGENNPWPQRVLERRWRVGAAERARWGDRRRDEALAALDCLGVSSGSAQFWDLPDQGLTGKLVRQPTSLTNELAARIAAFAPTHFLAPSLQDCHPDHSALAVLALLARHQAANAGLGLLRQQLDYECATTGPAAIFVKWEPRRLFLDPAGWRLLHTGVSCSSESSSQRCLTVNTLAPFSLK